MTDSNILPLPLPLPLPIPLLSSLCSICRLPLSSPSLFGPLTLSSRTHEKHSNDSSPSPSPSFSQCVDCFLTCHSPCLSLLSSHYNYFEEKSKNRTLIPPDKSQNIFPFLCDLCELKRNLALKETENKNKISFSQMNSTRINATGKTNPKCQLCEGKISLLSPSNSHSHSSSSPLVFCVSSSSSSSFSPFLLHVECVLFVTFSLGHFPFQREIDDSQLRFHVKMNNPPPHSSVSIFCSKCSNGFGVKLSCRMSQCSLYSHPQCAAIKGKLTIQKEENTLSPISNIPISLSLSSFSYQWYCHQHSHSQSLSLMSLPIPIQSQKESVRENEIPQPHPHPQSLTMSSSSSPINSHMETPGSHDDYLKDNPRDNDKENQNEDNGNGIGNGNGNGNGNRNVSPSSSDFVSHSPPLPPPSHSHSLPIVSEYVDSSGWIIIRREGEDDGDSGDPCQVCGDPWNYDDDPIVLCDGQNGKCPFMSHTSCNGDQLPPEDEKYFCSLCTKGFRMGEVHCAICQTKEVGPMRPVKGIKGTFAHVVCALFSPQCQFTDEDRTQITIPHTFHKEMMGHCALCLGIGGVVHKCFYFGCQKTFHAQCGIREGFSLQKSDSNAVEILCDFHDKQDKFGLRRRKSMKNEKENHSESLSSPSSPPHHGIHQNKRVKFSSSSLSPTDFDDFDESQIVIPKYYFSLIEMENPNENKTQREMEKQKSKNKNKNKISHAKLKTHREKQRPKGANAIGNFKLSSSSPSSFPSPPSSGDISQYRNWGFSVFLSLLSVDLSESTENFLWIETKKISSNFLNFYRNRVRDIQFNLKTNENLREKVLNGTISPSHLVQMSSADMALPSLQSIRNDFLREENLLIQKGIDEITTVKDIHTGIIRYFQHGKEISQSTMAMSGPRPI